MQRARISLYLRTWAGVARGVMALRFGVLTMCALQDNLHLAQHAGELVCLVLVHQQTRGKQR